MNEELANTGQSQFMPHGFCYLWQPELVWLHALSDLTIALAYFAIPITIVILMARQKKRIPYIWVFGMFATFIFLCGLSHVIEVISIWNPIYYFAGLVKVLTAAVSIATAMLMFPLIPTLIERFEQEADNNHHKNNPHL
jgi:hypothetical protein